MSADPERIPERAEQAAQWFARLNATSVSNAELAAFRRWRLEPANGEAYDEVARLWRGAGDLHSDPEIRAASASLLASAKRRRTTRGVLIGGGLVAAVLCVGWFLSTTSVLSPVKVFETAVGEQRSVVLDDGSVVKLDTDTQIAVRYTTGRRSVALDHGQALFEVVHQPSRPFQVQAGTTHIEDLGTVFDVRRDRDRVRVTLVAGAVQVRTGGAQTGGWELRPGQQLTAGAPAARPIAIDAAKATSWTSGRLVFDDLPLSVATAEVNRYGRRKVILDAGAIGDIRINGAFEASDTDAFVSAVSKLYDLNVRRGGNGSIILSVPSQKSSA